MYEWLQQHGPELICLTGGGVAAFMMALLRSFSLNRKTFGMKVADALMLSMFLLSLLIIIGHGFSFWDMWWAVVLGTFAGYFGFAGLHQIIAVVLGVAVTTQLNPNQANKLGPMVELLIKMLKQGGASPPIEPPKDTNNDPKQ